MTDDKPEISSEEMLRQAREAFGNNPADPANPATPVPPVDAGPPSAPTGDDPLSSTSLIGSGLPEAPAGATPDAAVSESAPAAPGSEVPAPPQAWTPPATAATPPAPGQLPPPLAPSSPGAPSTPSAPSSPGAPSTPSAPSSPGAPSSPSTTSGSGGIEYYAADEFKPQSYGAGGAGAPPPPASMGFPQQNRQPMSQPSRSRGSNIPWRLVIGIGAVAIFAIIGAIASRGTTSANNLDVGDCFMDPGFGDFSKVDDQDCAEPHDIQIFAEIKNVPASLANPTALGAESAGVRCEEALFDLLAGDLLTDPNIVIPDDTSMGMLTEADSRSTTDVLCTIESPSGGLVGSVFGDN